jgi:hypothetical protein
MASRLRVFILVAGITAISTGAGRSVPAEGVFSCKPNEFCVRRQQMSGTCKVQAGTEAALGADFRGPFKSRGEATTEMCRLYEPASEDAGKCAAVIPNGACNRAK